MNAPASETFAPCIVHITTGSRQEAETIAHALVSERLSACCTVVPCVKSFYRWREEMRQDDEWLVLCKTSRGLFGALSARVAELHSYDVPEIIAVPVTDASASYLDWMKDSVSSRVINN
jgi:periplasmic divalent cation tolerance protein